MGLPQVQTRGSPCHVHSTIRAWGPQAALPGLHGLYTQTDHRVLTWLGAPQDLCADLQGSRGVCPLWDGGWVSPDLGGGQLELQGGPDFCA